MPKRNHLNVQISAHCKCCNTQRLFATSATGFGLLMGIDKPRCQTCGTPATATQIFKDMIK